MLGNDRIVPSDTIFAVRVPFKFHSTLFKTDKLAAFDQWQTC